MYQKSLPQLSVQFSLFENPGAVIGSCELFPKLWRFKEFMFGKKGRRGEKKKPKH